MTPSRTSPPQSMDRGAPTPTGLRRDAAHLRRVPPAGSFSMHHRLRASCAAQELAAVGRQPAAQVVASRSIAGLLSRLLAILTPRPSAESHALRRLAEAVALSEGRSAGLSTLTLAKGWSRKARLRAQSSSAQSQKLIPIATPAPPGTTAIREAVTSARPRIQYLPRTTRWKEAVPGRAHRPRALDRDHCGVARTSPTVHVALDRVLHRGVRGRGTPVVRVAQHVAKKAHVGGAAGPNHAGSLRRESLLRGIRRAAASPRLWSMGVAATSRPVPAPT